MDTGAGHWWLTAHLAPSRPDTKVDVAIQRKLSDAEEQQAREVNAFVRRLASAAPYALLVKLYQELEQVMGRDLSHGRRASEMNRTARALGKVASNLADDLRRHARDDFGPRSNKNQELEIAIIEETERAPFQLLVAVGQLQQGPFVAVEDGVTDDTDVVAALGAEVPGVQPTVDVVAGLRAGVVMAQRLIGRQLLIYKERIEEASLYLRRLAAEVPDGAPTLMRSDSFDPERGERNLGQTTFDPLALDRALDLHRALKHARTLLEATSSVKGPDEAFDRARDEASEGNTKPVQDDFAATTSGPAEAQSAAGSEAAGPLHGDREDQVVDLRALAEHATAFTDELEKAWSAALDGVLLAEAQQEMDSRYAALLCTIQRRAAVGDRTLRAAGVDPQLPAHPLPPEEIARLSLDPDPEQRWRQRQLAELDALMLLLEALKAIRAPSAHMIYLDQQRVESWWEAGAFALVRDRAAFLVRVSEQVVLAEAEVTGKSVTSAEPIAFCGRLRLASAALGHGDIEAALMHTRLALRLRAALERKVVPDDLLEQLAQDACLADDAPVLRLLDQATKRLSAGEELDIGAAMLIAPRALAVVRRLCLQTPQIILTALEEKSSRAGS